MSPERSVGPRHHQCPILPILPTIDHRNYIPRLAQIDEQELPVRAAHLRHKLDNSVLLSLGHLVDLSEPPAME